MDSTTDLKAAARPDLGVTRTALSAERTLMAWIRTALAMISFGFSIYKFIQALDAHQAHGPRRLGLTLAALGTASLVAGTLQYRSIIRSLGSPRPGFTMYVGVAVIAIGVVVIVSLGLRIGPFA